MDPNQLSVAFGVWAAVVGMIGLAIVWELSRLRGELRTMSEALNDHIVATEHRMTMAEADIRALKQFIPNNHFEMRG